MGFTLNLNRLNVLDQKQGSFIETNTKKYKNLEFKHNSNFNEITRDSVYQEENVRLKSERKKKLDFGEGHIPTNENNINI